MEEEEEPLQEQRVKSSNLKLNQVVQIKGSKPTAVLARPTATSQSSSKPQPPRASAGSAIRQAVTKMESEDDNEEEWSDVSELVEIKPRQLNGFKDQNGNIDKGDSNKG